MNPVDRQTLARKLEYLRKQLQQLEPYRELSEDLLRSDVTNRLIVERLLEVSVQSIIDCSRLLVALEDMRGIRDERDALTILAERGVISQELSVRLLRAKGFRNILVHEYVDIDPALLSAHLHAGVEDLWEFARSLAKVVEEDGKPV